MIITIIITLYLAGTYYLGHHWFLGNGSIGMFIVFMLSPIIFPFYIFCMLFMGLLDED